MLTWSRVTLGSDELMLTKLFLDILVKQIFTCTCRYSTCTLYITNGGCRKVLTIFGEEVVDLVVELQLFFF